jgi:formylglycine-generating enzyme required for sulfatase activity
LPTEAEWEHACRAGTLSAYAAGGPSEVLGRANLHDATFPCPPESYWHDHHAFTAPVGFYPANRWGLCDMHGNASEWCSDWYDVSYYARSPRNDPEGPAAGVERAFRGGSFTAAFPFGRSANRSQAVPRFADRDTGFRMAMSIHGQGS